jgi:hypothetical protein
MVKTSDKQSAKPARAKPAQPAAPGPANVEASFKPDGAGGGTLTLRYRGPLVEHDVVWLRVGERRHGTDWLETRDVKMDREKAAATVRVVFAPGEALQGATFAFFSLQGGAEASWDSAGKPFGCYVLDAASGALTTR